MIEFLYCTEGLLIRLFTVDDTIVAIASPLAPAHRGIVRISGDAVVPMLQRVGLLPADFRGSRPRRFPAALDLGCDLGSVDTDVMLWPTERSYTGQPSAELHLVGSLPILDAVVDRLIEVGARAARAGEFTMRAFLAGRLDLPQAEAVLGVIDAEDPNTLNDALSQLAGNLSRPLQAARSELLNLLADVEAGLDFVDEDIEFVEDEHLLQRLRQIRAGLISTADQLRERSASQSALEIVLRGLPNAGKSCLLNAITQTESAIVTEQAGTTRDSISVIFELDEHSIQITDTAGIEARGAHEADAAVLAKAQLQAIDAASRADLCLWCVDASGPASNDALDQLRGALAAGGGFKKSIEHWLLLTKSDLSPPPSGWMEAIAELGIRTLSVSAVSGSGMAELITEIGGVAERLDPTETGGVIGTAARCRNSLTSASTATQTAIALTQAQAGHELVAAEIRAAASAIGDVTGEVYTDDLLDRVFSRFCIGK
ncbi:tRNA modification GTPase [Allorhodopirellula solitaria]|uniref:tRNA modification GTPase MnmE n=1 Tax=Allorhodopirellula solitaria TaxID=2527987 RepID=A0A5C5XPB6_9BACT|nr:tRNA modification GTPase [Allorhodopirellula solitaria]TWT65057.1 tRNA modification GTPase MnmE [Allorhodopirellula solitaria]